MKRMLRHRNPKKLITPIPVGRLFIIITGFFSIRNPKEKAYGKKPPLSVELAVKVYKSEKKYEKIAPHPM